MRSFSTAKSEHGEDQPLDRSEHGGTPASNGGSAPAPRGLPEDNICGINPDA